MGDIRAQFMYDWLGAVDLPALEQDHADKR